MLDALLRTSSQSPDPWATVISTYSGYGVIGVTCIVLGLVVWKLWSKDQKDARESLARMELSHTSAMQASKDALDREIRRTEQERARADKAEQSEAALNRELREKVVPALIESSRAAAELIAALRNRDGR